jgi:hypothetical protein
MRGWTTPYIQHHLPSSSSSVTPCCFWPAAVSDGSSVLPPTIGPPLDPECGSMRARAARDVPPQELDEAGGQSQDRQGAWAAGGVGGERQAFKREMAETQHSRSETRRSPLGRSPDSAREKLVALVKSSQTVDEEALGQHAAGGEADQAAQFRAGIKTAPNRKRRFVHGTRLFEHGFAFCSQHVAQARRSNKARPISVSRLAIRRATVA